MPSEDGNGASNSDQFAIDILYLLMRICEFYVCFLD